MPTVFHHTLVPPPHTPHWAPSGFPRRRGLRAFLHSPLKVILPPPPSLSAFHRLHYPTLLLHYPNGSVFHQPRIYGPRVGYCCHPLPLPRQIFCLRHYPPNLRSAPLLSASLPRFPLAPSAGAATSDVTVAATRSLPPLVPHPTASRRTDTRRPTRSPRSLPLFLPPLAASRHTDTRHANTRLSMGNASCHANTQRLMGEASCARDRTGSVVAIDTP